MSQRGRAPGRPRSGAGPGPSPRRRPAAGPGDLATRRAQLRAVVEPVIAAAGYDLEDLTLTRAGRRHLVRVTVDGDGDLSLDSVAEVSRALSAALDAAEESGGELLAGEYVLEVSSPGVDRPLTEPRHWRRAVGRLVTVALAAGGELTGRIVAADLERVQLEVAGAVREFGYAELGAGRVQVEFTRLDDAAGADVGPDDADADDGPEDADANGGPDADGYPDDDRAELEDEER